jgi:hypothetical protein
MPTDAAIDTTPTEVPAAICRCGTTTRHAAHGDRCSNGHQLSLETAQGPGVATKHGVRSFQIHGDAVLTDEQRAARRSFIEEVIADRGGESELTAIERARIKRLSELDVVAAMIAADLARRGLFTPKGRIRSSIDKWLSVLVTFDRYADKVGAERRPKALQSLADYLKSPSDAGEVATADQRRSGAEG